MTKPIVLTLLHACMHAWGKISPGPLQSTSVHSTPAQSTGPANKDLRVLLQLATFPRSYDSVLTNHPQVVMASNDWNCGWRSLATVLVGERLFRVTWTMLTTTLISLSYKKGILIYSQKIATGWMQ